MKEDESVEEQLDHEQPRDTLGVIEKNDSQSAIDRWSTRLAAWSQVALLLVVSLGYIFTVRPAFQYQRLQEKTAKLEIEKEATQTELQRLESERSEVSDKIALLKKTLAAERDDRRKLAQNLEQTRNRELNSQKRLAFIEKQLAETFPKLETAQWELLLLEFRQILARLRQGRDHLPRDHFERQLSDLLPLDVASDVRDFIRTAKNEWVQPYEELLAAMEVLEKRNNQTSEFPKKYIEELRQYIVDNRSKLICDKVDFDGISRRFESDISALERMVQEEAKVRVKELKRQNGKGLFTRVEIPEETEAAIRRMVRIEKQLDAQRKYHTEISELGTDCARKGTEVIEEFRAQKGVRRLN